MAALSEMVRNIFVFVFKPGHNGQNIGYLK